MSAIRYSFVASVVVIAMLTACGDEVTEVTNVNAPLDIVKKYKELPKCEESVYGSLNYVEDSSQVFACTSDGWVSLKGEKGAKGDEGKAGENGKNGESCTTKAVEGGVEVSCPGSEPVVIKNGDKGAEGKAGENGKNGTSCNIVSDKDGVVTIQCGEGENAKTTELYKAMCGTKPFDPKHQICFDNVVYNLCGCNVYDPELQFCAKFNDDAKTEQIYKMVTIAPEGTDYSETWMAENLNYKTANSWCYDDKDENCAKYGRLYTWAAAVGKTETECGDGQECNLGTGDIRGVCPEGWHLPSLEEWEDLIKAVGGESTAGVKLRSKTGWKEYSGINNEDAFGFSALPAGNRDGDGNYGLEGYDAEFWSSTEVGGVGAYSMYLYYDNENKLPDFNSKVYGFSVRCLKD